MTTLNPFVSGLLSGFVTGAAAVLVLWRWA